MSEQEDIGTRVPIAIQGDDDDNINQSSNAENITKRNDQQDNNNSCNNEINGADADTAPGSAQDLLAKSSKHSSAGSVIQEATPSARGDSAIDMDQLDAGIKLIGVRAVQSEAVGSDRVKVFVHRPRSEGCMTVKEAGPPAECRTQWPAEQGTELLRVLVICQAADCAEECADGVDIATLAVVKTAQALPAHFRHTLSVGGVAPSDMASTRRRLDALVGRQTNVQLNVHAYESRADVLRDLAGHSLCLVPSRCEPHGHAGLLALSAALPTLLSDESSLAPLVRRLAVHPQHFIGERRVEGQCAQAGASLRDTWVQCRQAPAFTRVGNLK